MLASLEVFSKFGYASSGMREDSVAYRRCRHAVGTFLGGMNGFYCVSRVAETVEDVREVCSRAGSHLRGRTVY